MYQHSSATTKTPNEIWVVQVIASSKIFFYRPLCHFSVKRRIWEGRNSNVRAALQTEEYTIWEKYVCYRVFQMSLSLLD